MPRSMWKGAIQFGLVTIPVKMYVATESKGVQFHMLHSTDHSRIQMKTFCPADDAIIERSDTVKGFEISPDQYVVVTDEDLSSVPLKTVRSIEIAQFVPIDSDGATTRFVKQAYYLEPEPVARKAFFLLKRILQTQGLRAICKIVLRDREQLASLDPFDETIMLSTLYWPDEVRPVSELSVHDEGGEPKPAELAMAEQLVAMMTGEFDANAYHDEYREALLQLIQAKAAGETVAAPAAAPVSKLGDLMAALEASVSAARQSRREQAPETVAAASARKQTGAARKPARVAVPIEADEQPTEAVPARRRKAS